MTAYQDCQRALLTRRIGNTTFHVWVHFNKDATETMEDKIVRLVRNEALANGHDRGIMKSPQTSRSA